MLSATLLDHTRARFPDYSPEDIAVTALEKGGSDRKFYRIDTGADRSLILIKYSDQRPENGHYVALAHFLADHGVNVPQIYHHDPTEGLIWMQDLGEIDLWAHREEPWETRRAFYEKSLLQIARLHAMNPANLGDIHFQPAFDEPLYHWEQTYFFENCLGRHFGKTIASGDFPELAVIRKKLSQLPRVLVHRDFQSQNIMLCDDDAWLIDFQGMRLGLRQYDLASLLYDPYVNLTSPERDELLTYYQGVSGHSEADFLETFNLCALQRLMQALGAYGFLGLVKDKPDFLRHIPKALASLKEVVQKIPSLENFNKLLTSLETGSSLAGAHASRV